MTEILNAIDVVDGCDRTIGKLILERKPVEKGSDVWIYKLRLEPQVIKLDADNKFELVIGDGKIKIK